MNKNRIIAALSGLCLLFAVAACSADTGQDSRSTEEKQRDTVDDENRAAATGFSRLVDSQQIPVFDFSQERQTLIETLTMRAQGTHGTAYATTLDGTLIWWCPTQGAPIPSTYQLTPSEQYVDIKSDDTRQKFPVDQGEQTGVYVGDSAATWTLCLDDSGKPFAKYEESNVGWTSGVVNDMPADRQAKVDEITFEFTDSEG